MSSYGGEKYHLKLQTGLSPGSKLTITGKVSNSPFRIDIDLSEDAPPARYIALHFNPRFTENAVVRDTCWLPGWGKEEKHGGFPFRAGTYFKLDILCGQTSFHLSVDDQFFAEYLYRVPLDRVKYVRVAYDVEEIGMTRTCIGGNTSSMGKCAGSGSGHAVRNNDPKTSVAIIAVKSSEEVTPSRPSGPLTYAIILDYFNKGQVRSTQFRMEILKVTHVQMQVDHKLSGNCLWLWHGTRPELLPSIFQSGLLPPERETKGLLGDGIYFADRSSKSAQYCYKGNQRPSDGYLLLCKVQMGSIYTALTADNSRKSAPEGYQSVQCKGQYIPDPKGTKSVAGGFIPIGPTIKNSGPAGDIGKDKKLLFNEYVVYSANNVCASYLVHFKFI